MCGHKGELSVVFSAIYYLKYGVHNKIYILAWNLLKIMSQKNSKINE